MSAAKSLVVALVALFLLTQIPVSSQQQGGFYLSFDFTSRVTTASGELFAGRSISLDIYVFTAGFLGSVRLSTGSLPNGVFVRFEPTEVSPAGYGNYAHVLVRIDTSFTTLPGLYAIELVGSGDNWISAISYSLRVYQPKYYEIPRKDRASVAGPRGVTFNARVNWAQSVANEDQTFYPSDKVVVDFWLVDPNPVALPYDTVTVSSKILKDLPRTVPLASGQMETYVKDDAGPGLYPIELELLPKKAEVYVLLARSRIADENGRLKENGTILFIGDSGVTYSRRFTVEEQYLKIDGGNYTVKFIPDNIKENLPEIEARITAEEGRLGGVAGYVKFEPTPSGSGWRRLADNEILTDFPYIEDYVPFPAVEATLTICVVPYNPKFSYVQYMWMNWVSPYGYRPDTSFDLPQVLLMRYDGNRYDPDNESVLSLCQRATVDDVELGKSPIEYKIEGYEFTQEGAFASVPYVAGKRVPQLRDGRTPEDLKINAEIYTFAGEWGDAQPVQARIFFDNKEVGREHVELKNIDVGEHSISIISDDNTWYSPLPIAFMFGNFPFNVPDKSKVTVFALLRREPFNGDKSEIASGSKRLYCFFAGDGFFGERLPVSMPKTVTITVSGDYTNAPQNAWMYMRMKGMSTGREYTFIVEDYQADIIHERRVEEDVYDISFFIEGGNRVFQSLRCALVSGGKYNFYVTYRDGTCRVHPSSALNEPRYVTRFTPRYGQEYKMLFDSVALPNPLKNIYRTDAGGNILYYEPGDYVLSDNGMPKEAQYVLKYVRTETSDFPVATRDLRYEYTRREIFYPSVVNVENWEFDYYGLLIPESPLLSAFSSTGIEFEWGYENRVPVSGSVCLDASNRYLKFVVHFDCHSNVDNFHYLSEAERLNRLGLGADRSAKAYKWLEPNGDVTLHVNMYRRGSTGAEYKTLDAVFTWESIGTVQPVTVSAPKLTDEAARAIYGDPNDNSDHGNPSLVLEDSSWTYDNAAYVFANFVSLIRVENIIKVAALVPSLESRFSTSSIVGSIDEYMMNVLIDETSSENDENRIISGRGLVSDNLYRHTANLFYLLAGGRIGNREVTVGDFVEVNFNRDSAFNIYVNLTGSGLAANVNANTNYTGSERFFVTVYAPARTGGLKEVVVRDNYGKVLFATDYGVDLERTISVLLRLTGASWALKTEALKFSTSAPEVCKFTITRPPYNAEVVVEMTNIYGATVVSKPFHVDAYVPQLAANVMLMLVVVLVATLVTVLIVKILDTIRARRGPPLVDLSPRPQAGGGDEDLEEEE